MGLSVMSEVYRAACERRSAACTEISRQSWYHVRHLAQWKIIYVYLYVDTFQFTRTSQR